MSQNPRNDWWPPQPRDLVIPPPPPASRTAVEDAQTEKPIDMQKILREVVDAAGFALEASSAIIVRYENAWGRSLDSDRFRDAYTALKKAWDSAHAAGSPRVHRLKADPGPFRQVWAGMKPFEVRKFDRDFRVGDELKLSEFDREARAYSGAWIKARITSIVRPGEYDLPPGVGVLGIEVLDQGEA